jgi:hypothetical protein
MEYKLSEQYKKHLLMIAECHLKRQLISLMEIYIDYGRPKNMSPKRVLRKRTYRELIKDEIIKSGYMVEKVIRYTKDDIMVNRQIAKVFLNSIDEVNYVISLFGKTNQTTTGTCLPDFLIND